MTDKAHITDLAHRSLTARRLRDISVLLPLFGILIFMTPVMRVFATGSTVFGIPVAFLFLFGAWLGLILLARRLAVRLSGERGE